MSIHQLICYKDIGRLLGDHLREHKMSSDRLADAVQVARKTAQRWLTLESTPTEDNLIRIARTQAIPFELLVRLRSKIPTWYNLLSRRMAYSPFEQDFVNRRVVQRELFKTGNWQRSTITVGAASPKLEAVLRHRRRIYPLDQHVPRPVVEKAAELAPTLNLIAEEANGTYAGHILTFPLKADAYGRLQKGLHESRLAVQDLEPVDSAGLRALHIYSFYACTSYAAYVLLQHMVCDFLRRWEDLVARRCNLTRWPVTEDGEELADKLGMHSRFGGGAAPDPLTGIVPKFWEARFGRHERHKDKGLEWIWEYRRDVRL